MNEEVLATFREECRELLEQMESILLAAESAAPAADDLNALFRCAHTLKGSGGLFGFDRVVAFTHRVESVLDRLRNGDIPFDPALSALLLECRDHMEHLVKAAVGGEPVREAAGEALARTLDSYLEPAKAAGFNPESCYQGFEIDLKSGASKAEIEGVFDFVRDDATIRILPPHSRVEERVSLFAALERQKQGEEKRTRESRSLKVPSERLDRLIDLVGELVIAGAAAELAAERSRQPELRECAANLLRLVEDVRDISLKLRMVPIGEVFSRFPRVVRDTARELGKDIDLVIGGAETELDKTMVEKIADPLTHMVRNAMDHGIEPEGVRLAAGKPARGTVRLNACHESGGIVIEVADDGGGLNCDKILQKARERGLVAPDQNLTRREIFRLILEPGFSTADKITNLSGRGVGMDVVKASVEALRGTLDIDSEPGRGTTMRICLPLTLAIIDGFRVALGNNVYIVPLDMVEECIEQPGAEADAGCLNLRGEVLPLVRLRNLFEIDGPVPERRSVVVVRVGRQKAGLVVDRLVGEFQTVIKPLSKMFGQLRGIAGSTILGSGQVALILDVPALIDLAASREEAGAPASF